MSELTNDAGYITTDSDTTYSAGTGITLTGTTFSNDLGTDIATGELQDDAVTSAKVLDATLTADDLADDSVSDAEIDFANVTLTDFTNDAGFVTTDNDTTYSAGTGITLTGTTFSNDLGTTIETGEITNGTITFADLNSTDITLADFTNDAGFLTTVDISDDTNLAAGTGATLTGDTLSVDLGTSIDASEIDTNAVNDDEINYTTVTLADFTNDAGFVTTDNDTTYSAGTGITLTGTTFSNDLGSDIDVSEIVSAGVGDADKVLTTSAVGVPQWEVKSNFATSAQGALADSALQSGDNVSELTNDAGYLTSDSDTTYTAGSGLTLTGTTFSNDLGTSIDETEIDADSIQDSEMDYTAVTLSDFTNDAGFVTTDNDTTYTGSGGITLTGTNFTSDLGTTIETGEITNGTITFADLNSTDITLADFTNDAGFVTTDNDTTYSAGTGITLTGTTFSNDLGTDIDDTELDFGSVTLSDFTNDAGFVTTDNDTTYTGSGGITLTGTNFTSDLGTSISLGELENGGNNQVLTTTGAGVPQWENKSNFATSAQGALADSALQSGDNVSELTNDAGYLTSDSDTTYTAGSGLTLTGTTFSNDLGTSIDETEIDADSIQDSEMDYTAVTLADFTNDAGFVTTDNDTTYTGSGGITLTGTNFTSDLGTSIDASEIDTNAVNDDEINYTTVTLSDFTNDAGYITSDSDTTYTAGSGLTLTGTTFSNDLGTTIETGEITNGTITFADLNSTDITLADFTNDAGFVTTDNDTTYTGGTGITLTGTTFSNDLGTNIATGELQDDAVTSAKVLDATLTADDLADDSVSDAELDFANVTLADFTNDAGFITSDSDTTYTAGTGLTLTGTSFSNDLGTSISSAEIELNTIVADDIATNAVGAAELADNAVDTAAIANNAVNGTKIALGSDTAGDVMYYNGTDWTRLPVGAAGEVLQVNAGATAPEWSAGTATKYQFIDIFGCVRGSASAGTVGGGNSPVVRFDAAGNSQMRCALPVPSDWQAGTDINVEVYYSPADNTAGNVQFELKHAAYGVGETVSNGDFTDTVTGTEAISASTELDIYELIEDIPAAGLALDDMINFNLRRTPGVAADTYAGDINIHQLRISYTGKEL